MRVKLVHGAMVGKNVTLPTSIYPGGKVEFKDGYHDVPDGFEDKVREALTKKSYPWNGAVECESTETKQSRIVPFKMSGQAWDENNVPKIGPDPEPPVDPNKQMTRKTRMKKV